VAVGDGAAKRRRLNDESHAKAQSKKEFFATLRLAVRFSFVQTAVHGFAESGRISRYVSVYERPCGISRGLRDTRSTIRTAH
jgi:hypothetical protein